VDKKNTFLASFISKLAVLAHFCQKLEKKMTLTDAFQSRVKTSEEKCRNLR